MPMLLAYRLALVMVLMSFTRWLFYFFNTAWFSSLNFFELLHLMTAGLRFDFSALAMVNIPIILLLAVPLVYRYDKSWQHVVHAVYVALNGIALALNLIDTIYFRYIGKRTTSELFQFFGNESENRMMVVGGVLGDYWYMFFIWLLLLWVLYKAGKYFVPMSPPPVRKASWYIWQSIILQFWFAAFIIMVRGGFQMKPINVVTAARYASPEHMALVLNTPFSVVKTYNAKNLKTIRFFDESEINTVFTPEFAKGVTQPSDSCLRVSQANVVIIILESFGQEHLGFFRPDRTESYTPFLDSLLGISHTFGAWANGKRSIEALPSVLAGIPSLMHVDYPTSPYAGNRISGLGRLLKAEGYSTAFFHGGSNGTMSFDAFAAAAGFQHYYGRTEYGNEKDFDGKWGIFDEPFLQFVAQKISDMPEPFAAGVFTLSSHHPYTIPPSNKIQFAHVGNEIQQSIAYTDFALKRFFETIRMTSWFHNTLFVITADHTSEDDKHPAYNTLLGTYAVPLAFYHPAMDCSGRPETIAQHTDVMPSVLSLLGYNKPFLAFGNNLFDDSRPHYSLSFLNGMYQLIMDDYVLHFDGNKTVALYSLSFDPQLQNNLKDEHVFVRMRHELFLKAIIQQYNNRMIRNELKVAE